MKDFLLKGTIFTVGLLLIVELFFRFILPASEWPKGVILDSGIRRFDSEGFSTGRFTYGRICRGKFLWSINNSGWNSIYDYEQDSVRNRPMVAILGDSYLEGFYSDVEKHIDVYLTELFEDTVCFYTFAMSGGILSQYIALMKYEVEQYSPDAYIVFVNSSDILMSVRELSGRHPYFFQYSVDSYGTYREVTPVAESRSSYKDLVLRSAFVRYLRANAQISLFGAGLADDNANREESAVDQSSETDISRELEDAAEFILGELNSFDRPVLIVADCPKSWIYYNRPEEEYDDVIVLRESVDSFPNVYLLELAAYYQTDYAEHHQPFSVAKNSHWNYYANSFVANTIAPLILPLLLTRSGLEI